MSAGWPKTGAHYKFSTGPSQPRQWPSYRLLWLLFDGPRWRSD